MLRYLAYGERRYRDQPVRPYPRERWEFQAVLRGAIAPLIPGRVLPAARAMMWLMPPQHGHGWTGDGGTATIVSLHPVRVPASVERTAARLARTGRLLTWELTAGDQAWLEAEVQALIPAYGHPGAVDLLHQERLVLEICIRALATQPDGVVEAPDDRPERLVDQALTWFLDHLADAPDEAAVARAAHCSPAHLRRLFHLVLGASPRDILLNRRLRHADTLLVSTDQPLEQVAAACGFASASTFCRAYRRACGRSPGQLRQERPGLNRIESGPG